MALTVLRMGAFLLSAGGYVLLLNRKFHLDPAFAPALFCAGVSHVLLCAGLLNLLPLVWPLLFLGGLWLLLRYGRLFLKERRSPSRRLLILCGAFLLGLAYSAWLLWGVRVNEYDNFSHYATVLMDMLRSNTLPSFKSVNIQFQAYPVGSTLFQYYVCRIVGAEEFVALWANMFITLSGVLAVAAFARGRKGGFLPVLAFGLFALLWRADMNSLLVDTILPVSAAAAFAMLYAYRSKPKKAAWLAGLTLCFVTNIKNSGFFFAGACLVCLWVWLRGRPLRERLRAVGLPAAACAALLLIWQRHTAMVYLDAAHTRHALTPHYILQTLRGKDLAEFTGTAKALFLRCFDPGNRAFQALLLLSLALLLLAALSRGRRSPLLRAAGLAWALYLSYHLGLLAMYMGSMPQGGDLSLAGYGRYAGSILVFILGTAAVLTEAGFEPTALPDRWRTPALCALLLFLLPLVPYRGSAVALVSRGYHQRLYEETDRYLLDRALARCPVPEGLHYILYTENDPDYLAYVARYELWTGTADAFGPQDELDPEALEGYDYLLYLQNTAPLREKLAACGCAVPDDGLPGVIQLR